MPLRRILGAAAILILAIGCEPSIPFTAPPSSVVTALFDPNASEIPLPNDLLLQQDPATLGVSPAQQELIKTFQAQGGYPNDQEVSVTLGFGRAVIGADGTVTRHKPELDFGTFTASTFFVYGVTAQSSGEVPLEPLTASDYAEVPDAAAGQSHGLLTLHHQGRAPWAPGKYLVFLRGGPSGAKTKEGDSIWASQIFHLIAQGQDLTTQENIGLIRALSGSMEEALAQAKQLNAIIAGYRPAFAVADTRFPHEELALLASFTVAPAVTQVELDPARGLVPLPIDLLRDPRPASAACAACGKLTALAACTLAGATLDAAGVCRDSHGSPSAAAAGFATLDGFSTTAPVLASTSDLVAASSVNPSTVLLYDLSGAAPVQVAPSTLIYEPCELTSSGFSPAIALQPAGATGCDATSVLRTRPLKENTAYAVVISDGVKDKAGKALGRGTVANVLLFDNPLVDGDGASQLQGIDDATAGALEVMRRSLKPVLAAAATAGVAKSHVAMAYTFKTESFASQAVQLGALPYTLPAATGLPSASDTHVLTAAQAFTKYGVDPGKVPSSHIGQVIETTIVTANLLDPASGAFLSSPAQASLETLHVLIATPLASNPNVLACAGAMAPFAPLRCAPMMIFRHGLGGGRADALTVADGFADQGLVTVAIDAAKHGDRSLCSKGDTTIVVQGTSFPVCADGAACVSSLPAGAQGDAKPPGTCAAGFAKRPVSASCAGNPACTGESDGIPLASGNFLVTANFFRTRDTLRQDIIDQSQLVRAIAFVPSSAPPTGHAVFDEMAGTGLVIDPGKVYFSGQSLGAIQGTLDVATNPRIAKAVLNVGGGTLVDIFTTSPAFSAATGALLAGLGIAPGTTAYLQFLSVAKTILDPADPVNFAGHLTTHTLPNLLPPLGGAQDGSVPQAPKQILIQGAFCDQVVPNPFSLIWASTAGVGPLPGLPGFGGPGTLQLFYRGTAAPTQADLLSCPAPGGSPIPAGAVSHGFLTDWTDAVITGKAQHDAGAFVSTDALPGSLTVLP